MPRQFHFLPRQDNEDRLGDILGFVVNGYDVHRNDMVRQHVAFHQGGIAPVL